MSRLLIILSAGVLVLLPTTQSLLAVDHQRLRTDWRFLPESSKSHPKRITMAMVADEDLGLTACHLWYHHFRVSLTEPRRDPPIVGGGHMKVILKVIGKRGRRKIAKYSLSLDPDRQAILGWSDSPMEEQNLALTYGLRTKRSGRFPFHVEAGDMLLWIVRFNGAPPVEVDREGPTPFTDELWLHPWCESCGTVDRPCADYWTNFD